PPHSAPSLRDARPILTVAVVSEDVLDLHLAAVDLLVVGDLHLVLHRVAELEGVAVLRRDELDLRSLVPADDLNRAGSGTPGAVRAEEHTSELPSRLDL